MPEMKKKVYLSHQHFYKNFVSVLPPNKFLNSRFSGKHFFGGFNCLPVVRFEPGTSVDATAVKGPPPQSIYLKVF